MEQHRSLMVASDWSTRHRARRGDERSRALVRLRARVMAEAALELALEGHRLERGRGRAVRTADDCVTGEEAGVVERRRPRQHCRGDKRQRLEDRAGDEVKASCGTSR